MCNLIIVWLFYSVKQAPPKHFLIIMCVFKGQGWAGEQ